MLKIGLTGGIGSGKSRVADFFAEWGASIVDTDVIAHELTAPGGQGIGPLRDAFGEAMISPEGALDRSAMRALVFQRPAARQQLEAILHPLISSRAEQLGEQATGHYLVFVVPLLVESGRWRDRVDRICVVDCDPETQVARVQARSGLTSEAIGRIMSVQASRAQRLAAADDVITNDAQTTISMLRDQALQLHNRWRHLQAQL